MKAQQQAKWILSGLVLCALGSIVLACLLGSVSVSLVDSGRVLVGWSLAWLDGAGASAAADSLAASVLQLRLERALAGFVTGASLALAGVLMQALLRNPLSDPYVLGISGGASVGALLAILLFGVAWAVSLAALLGALAIAGLLFVLAHREVRGDAGEMAAGSSSVLLLTGVMLASGCGALVTLLLSVAPDARLRGMVFWLIGDLSATTPSVFAWGVLVAVLLLVLRRARALNLLAMHAEYAITLGVNVTHLRQILFFAASILTASAVSGAGSIGFVGLIIPHACRFAWGTDHRMLIPAATLAGGAFLVLADTLARSVVAPQQLPVGVITALIGVPVFLLQLHQLRHHHRGS